MAATSLQQLLSQDGFRRRRAKPAKTDVDAVYYSSYLCRDRRSVDSSNGHHRRSRSLPFVSKTGDCSSSTSVSHCTDNVESVISSIATYVGVYLKDSGFRERLRERCTVCLEGRRDDDVLQVLANLQMGMENVERLVESKIKPLKSSVRLLSIVATKAKSDLSACAHIYLAIIYGMERNDRGAARHLLQVFCDAPDVARKRLLPELWDRLFLPHLLHLKVWYDKEVEVMSVLDAEERDRSLRGLGRVYNDRMDFGTVQFALYYKGWIKVGGKCPAAPLVPVPPRSSYIVTLEKKSSPFTPRTANKSLRCRAVFSHQEEMREDKEGSPNCIQCVDSEKDMRMKADKIVRECAPHMDTVVQHGSSSSILENGVHGPHPAPCKSYSFRLFSCQNGAGIGNMRSQTPKKQYSQVAGETYASAPLLDLSRSIDIISSSSSLNECEAAVRVIARTWLDLEGDHTLETALSSVSVIEGLLEVLWMSKNDEVLELIISLLAELVSRNDVNRQVILASDSQLEIFMRLLSSHSFFLKVAVLLHLLRPRAKQMLSMDWIPLVLRVLDSGDRIQTLFSVRCSPNSAAFYLLDQLLLGFDVDRNVENAKQVVSLGGLRLLIKWLELGDLHERRSAANLLTKCMQADGSCREFVAANINKKSIVELLIGNQMKSSGCALLLLIELLCLGRRTQITRFTIDLKSEGCLNTMHILLVYLQQAPAEQRPLIAVVLLHLDLLGDPLQYSVYREEAIDSIIRALNCTDDNRVQKQCSRALLVLAGRFTTTGEISAESWLLKMAGFDDCPPDSCDRKDIGDTVACKMVENDSTEQWLGRLANVLIIRGQRCFLIALSNCIANGSPTLTRSCLVTVAWMTRSLKVCPTSCDLLSLACSVFIPQLLENLKYDRPLEERVLASMSLFNFTRNSDCLSKIVPLSRHLEGLLRDLSRFTWTARETLITLLKCRTSTLSCDLFSK